MAIRLRIFEDANIQSAPSIQEIIIFSTCNKSFLYRPHFSTCVHISINLHKHPHSNSYIILKNGTHAPRERQGDALSKLPWEEFWCLSLCRELGLLTDKVLPHCVEHWLLQIFNVFGLRCSIFCWLFCAFWARLVLFGECCNACPAFDGDTGVWSKPGRSFWLFFTQLLHFWITCEPVILERWFSDLLPFVGEVLFFGEWIWEGLDWPAIKINSVCLRCCNDKVLLKAHS